MRDDENILVKVMKTDLKKWHITGRVSIVDAKTMADGVGGAFQRIPWGECVGLLREFLAI